MLIAAVCTGNTCRSPMLERLIAKHAAAAGRADVQVVSAGVAAQSGAPASEHSVQVMGGYGIDLGNHRSRLITELELTAIDLFVTMSARHAAVLHEMGVPPQRIRIAGAAQGGIPDPFGGDRAAYEATAAALDAEARAVVNSLS